MLPGDVFFLFMILLLLVSGCKKVITQIIDHLYSNDYNHQKLDALAASLSRQCGLLRRSSLLQLYSNAARKSEMKHFIYHFRSSVNRTINISYYQMS